MGLTMWHAEHPNVTLALTLTLTWLPGPSQASVFAPMAATVSPRWKTKCIIPKR